MESSFSSNEFIFKESVDQHFLNLKDFYFYQKLDGKRPTPWMKPWEASGKAKFLLKIINTQIPE